MVGKVWSFTLHSQLLQLVVATCAQATHRLGSLAMAGWSPTINDRFTSTWVTLEQTYSRTKASWKRTRTYLPIEKHLAPKTWCAFLFYQCLKGYAHKLMTIICLKGARYQLPIPWPLTGSSMDGRISWVSLGASATPSSSGRHRRRLAHAVNRKGLWWESAHSSEKIVIEIMVYGEYW